MTNNDPLIGQQLANFRIEHLLGRGGMAQVYYGLDVKLQRPVAIKVIDTRYRDNPTYAQRFVKEARAVARLRHENIIQIYYADDQDGLYYYVMEYIAGQDLAAYMGSYLDRGELMPLTEVLRIGSAVASALDYAHANGVIHRDVKPSNVILSEDSRVMLSDFGLALDIQQGTMGEAFGSPHYISPEQARRSADVVPQSDLYSLGVILFEMLTGVVPFDDESPTSVALLHITEVVPSPRVLNPQLPPEAETVLVKALSKSPAQRYQTGAELMDALGKALAHAEDTRRQKSVIPLPPMPASILTRQPVSPTRPIAPLKPNARKKSGLKIWLGLGLLALLGLAAFFLKPILFAAPQATATLSATFTSVAETLLTPTAVSSPSLSPTLAAELPAVFPLIETPTFTSVPTAAPTLTVDLAITSTEPPTATLTIAPTLDPSTFTPTVTESPTPEYTATLPATFTPTPFASPTLFPDAKHIQLLYDENSFYILNLSSATRSISAMSLERLNDDGTFADRFDGWIWGEFYPNLNPIRCMRIEILDQSSYLRPQQCEGRYLSSRFYYRDSEFIFWTAKEGSQFFHVLWLKQEVARCEIGAGSCDVYLP